MGKIFPLMVLFLIIPVLEKGAPICLKTLNFWNILNTVSLIITRLSLISCNFFLLPQVSIVGSTFK